jgi:hypothetical protein
VVCAGRTVWRAGRVCVEDVACVRGMRSRWCLLGL